MYIWVYTSTYFLNINKKNYLLSNATWHIFNLMIKSNSSYALAMSYIQYLYVYIIYIYIYIILI